MVALRRAAAVLPFALQVAAAFVVRVERVAPRAVAARATSDPFRPAVGSTAPAVVNANSPSARAYAAARRPPPPRRRRW